MYKTLSLGVAYVKMLIEKKIADLSGSDEELAVLAIVDGDCVGVVEEVDAAVLAVPHYHLFPCEKRV